MSSDPRLGPRALDLLSCVLSEFQALSDYEFHIKSAKSTLAKCRNSAPTIVPINALPPEVLGHIFELIHASWACPASPKRNVPTNTVGFRRSIPPIDLSHVCTRWRQVALGSPVLWSHVDISTSRLQESMLERIATCSKVFDSRAGTLSTSIRIDAVPDVTPVMLPDAIKLGRFYASTEKSPQMLQLHNWTGQGKFFSVLGLSLTSLNPGILKKLILVDHSVANGDRATLLDDVQAEAMDPCLLSLTALHLINVRLPWLSRAYSGLNDLRLIASVRYREFNIDVSQLRVILAASPALQIFHFNYRIGFDGRISGDLPRIPLEELRELNIRGMPDGHECLLELISPGTNPMSLSIGTSRDNGLLRIRHSVASYDAYDAIPTSVLAFLTRTNITELYIECYTGLEGFSFSGLLGEPLTRLRTLGLKGFMLDASSREPWPNQLDLLSLYNCAAHPGVLGDLAGVRAVKALNMCNCTLIVGHGLVAAHLGKWKNDLAEVFPDIAFISPLDMCNIGGWEYWEVPGAYP